MTRKTYHYDEKLGRMVEGPADRKTQLPPSDAFYALHPFKAHDGTVIDSRAKHRAYMKRHGLTTMDDFKGEWERNAKRRADVSLGRHDRAERVNDIIRAIEKHGGS